MHGCSRHGCKALALSSVLGGFRRFSQDASIRGLLDVDVEAAGSSEVQTGVAWVYSPDNYQLAVCFNTVGDSTDT